MRQRVSPRIAEMVERLPLRPGLRVLEIGCGPGVAAREVSRRIGSGTILAIDRSATVITSAIARSRDEIESGSLSFRCVAIEDFVLDVDEAPFDLAFAMRVGALDGRHRELEQHALARITAALAPDGPLIIDGGPPIRGGDIDA